MSVETITSRSVEAPSHTDMCDFARAMHEVTWQYSEGNGAENILDYFSAPHKWDQEYRMWIEFGGTLEKDCLRQLEDYLENGEPDDEEEA